MILSELLNITALNTQILIRQATTNRENPTIDYFTSINKYGKADTRKLDECIDKYGNMTVISQSINIDEHETVELEILVK